MNDVAATGGDWYCGENGANVVDEDALCQPE